MKVQERNLLLYRTSLDLKSDKNKINLYFELQEMKFGFEVLKCFP